MARQSLIKRCIKIIGISGIIACMATSAYATPNRKSWVLMSPRQNEVVKSGELFITVKLLDSISVFKGSFNLFIDDYLITTFVKFTPTGISVLYSLPLSEGRHKLELHIKAQEVGFLDPIKSEFTINKFAGIKKDSVIARKDYKFELQGSVSGDYKQISTTGPGAALLQAPPYISDVNINLLGRIGKVSFPFRYFNTSDEYTYPPGLQTRNYLQFGVQTQKLQLLYGDDNPVFDRLVLTGIRVHGLKFTYTSNKFQLQAIQGYAQRAVEGQLLTYNSTQGPVPPNLRADSTYIIPGYYKRNLTALRLSFGNRQEGSLFGINVLRTRDEVNSIQYGVNPTDNVVLGFDENFSTNANRMKLNAGFATSLYSTDISKGPATEHQIDSIQGYKLGFNPITFKDIFTFNATTVKPGLSASSAYITGVFRTTNQIITADYHYYGSAYTSEGNPYVRNDLQIGSLQDQVSILKRKIIISGRYMFQVNNLDANQFSTLQTQLIAGSIIIAPSLKLPQLSILYNSQLRNTLATTNDFIAVNDAANNLTGVLSYNFKISNAITSLSASYMRSIRTDAIHTFSSNETQIMNGGLSETFIKLGLSIDIHYTTIYFSNPETPQIALSNAYDAKLRYEVRKIKTFFSIGGYINQTLATSLGGASNRNLFNASISTQIVPNAIFDFEAGMAPYTDLSYSSNNYRENYALARLTYNFDWKR